MSCGSAGGLSQHLFNSCVTCHVAVHVRAAAKQYASDSRKRLQAMRGAEAAAAAAGGTAAVVPDAERIAAAMPPAPSAITSHADPKPSAAAPAEAAARQAAAADAPEPMHQDEADAVEALLAAASGDIDTADDPGQGGYNVNATLSGVCCKGSCCTRASAGHPGLMTLPPPLIYSCLT
jgi:hypothetical protein